MKDLSRVTKCKLCGIKEKAGDLTLSGECALRNDIPDNRIACKDRQIARLKKLLSDAKREIRLSKLHGLR